MHFLVHCVSRWWPVVRDKLMPFVSLRNAENFMKTTAQVGPTVTEPSRYAWQFVVMATQQGGLAERQVKREDPR